MPARVLTCWQLDKPALQQTYDISGKVWLMERTNTPHFHYSLLEKITFILTYIFYKLMVIFEVKRPRFKMFIYEMYYSLLRGYNHLRIFLKRKPLYQSKYRYWFTNDMIETKFGKFKIRKNAMDAIIVSTTHERRDVNYLIKRIKDVLNIGERALFIDIGAAIGSYTITVANYFKSRNIQILSIEPLEYNYNLLNQNLELNGIGKNLVKSYKVAAYNEDLQEIELACPDLFPSGLSLKRHRNEHQYKETIRVRARRLDTLLGGEISNFDVLFVKIDVEGSEEDVLRGAERILSTAKKIYILIEDFVNPGIINYLQGIKAIFVCKLTDYNSWWYIEN